ncbi:uncharacterized protein LOC127730288 [Mytilus californianus]|uniref:uncharacterized protein LOC127730288 n=1 Tax=Mytilus californianus TaxID=6549 RepID=UPI00224768FF|nr:uncharacterized protein LOC127730288 [Mytilus californianus]
MTVKDNDEYPLHEISLGPEFPKARNQLYKKKRLVPKDLATPTLERSSSENNISLSSYYLQSENKHSSKVARISSARSFDNMYTKSQSRETNGSLIKSKPRKNLSLSHKLADIADLNEFSEEFNESPENYSRSSSFHRLSSSMNDLSRPTTRMLKMRKSVSLEQMNKAHNSVNYDSHYPKVKRIQDSEVFKNDVRQYKQTKTIYNKEKPLFEFKNSKHKVSESYHQSMRQRGNERKMKTIRESNENIPHKHRKSIQKDVQTLQRPVSVSSYNSLRTFDNSFEPRPASRSSENRFMLLKKQMRQSAERPEEKKKTMSKRTNWKSPYFLHPVKPARSSIKYYNKFKNPKIEPFKSKHSVKKSNKKFASRAFATTDYDVISDSGVSADDSTSSLFEEGYPLPDTIQSFKANARRQVWH